MKANLLDLILGRHAPAAEAVDEDLRARAGHALQLLGHLVRIVRQRVDLFLRQRLGEAVVAPVGRVFLFDHHRLLDGRQHKSKRRPILTAPHVVRCGERAEALRLGLHLIGSGRQVLERRHAAIVHGGGQLDAA